MTQRQVSNLLRRQFRALSATAVENLSRSRRINPNMVRLFFLSNSSSSSSVRNAATLIKARAIAGDKWAFDILFNVLSKKDNSLKVQRVLAAQALFDVAKKGKEEALSGLVIGLKSEEVGVREYCANGLTELARRGVRKTLFGLTKALFDPSVSVSTTAERGIGHLIDGAVNVVPYVAKYKRRAKNSITRNKYVFLEHLARQGRPQAIKLLEELEK